MEHSSWNGSYLDSFASRDSLDISCTHLKELKIGCDHNHETRFGAVADSGYRDSSSLQSSNNCGSSQILSCKPSENDNNTAIRQKRSKLVRDDYLEHEDLENKNPSIRTNDVQSDITRSPMKTPKVLFPAKLKITTPSNMTVTSSVSHQYHRIVNDNDKDIMSGLNSDGKNSLYKSSAKSERTSDDLKSPKIRRVRKDAVTSTPCSRFHTASGEKQILATEINEDISPLQYSNDKSIGNAYTDSPKKLFKRLSQQFTASPQRFTQRLKTVIEETLSHSDFEKAENNDVSMDRLTQEFRKICSEHHSRIEDESMPAYTSICWNDTQEHLRRPLKLLTILDEKVGSPLNDTASFLYWENKCNSEESPIQRKQDTIDSFRRRVIAQDQSLSAEMKTGRARENLVKFIQSLIRSSENVPASPTENRDDFLKTLETCAKSLTGDQKAASCNSPLDCILECTEDTGSANSAVNTRITSDVSPYNDSGLSNSDNINFQNTSPIVQSRKVLDSPAASLVGSRNQVSKANKDSAKYPTLKSSPANNPNRTPKYPFVPKIVKAETPPRSVKKTHPPFLRNVNNGLHEQPSTPKQNEAQKSKFKFFTTPGRTPPANKSKPKKKYFENPPLSPGLKTSGQTKTNAHHASPYRLIYNAVTSPVATYIRGMDTKLIQNVNARTNDRMLTPTMKRPITKFNAKSTVSPSPGYKDSVGLKFKLSPTKISQQSRKEDIFNTAMCESDTSTCTQSTCASILPKVYYQPSTYLKMIKSDTTKLPGKALLQCEDKMIYRHEGRVKSSIPTKSPRTHAPHSFEDNVSADSADVSVVHQRPAVKTNYLCK